MLIKVKPQLPFEKPLWFS